MEGIRRLKMVVTNGLKVIDRLGRAILGHRCLRGGYGRDSSFKIH